MEVLPPCVQDCGRSELLRISGNGSESLGRDLDQQSIDLRLVLVRDRTDCARKSENQVTISNRQQLGFTRRKPCRCCGPLTI